jgi:hypothetical protein
MILGNFIYGAIGILLLPIGIALIQKLGDDGIIHLYKPLPMDEEEEKPSRLNAFINKIFAKIASVILAPFKKLFKRKKTSEKPDKKGNENE